MLDGGGTLGAPDDGRRAMAQSDVGLDGDRPRLGDGEIERVKLLSHREDPRQPLDRLLEHRDGGRQRRLPHGSSLLFVTLTHAIGRTHTRWVVIEFVNLLRGTRGGYRTCPPLPVDGSAIQILKNTVGGFIGQAR